MPKLSESKSSGMPKHPDYGNPAMDPSILDQFDPQMLTQMTQAFQKLPHGQLQKMQALMQKAMSGKDITQEAQEFERTLPSDFQSMMQSFAQSGAGLSAQAMTPQTLADSTLTQASSASTSQDTLPMSEAEARALIQQAAAQGQISQEEANVLLQHSQSTPTSSTGPSSSLDASPSSSAAAPSSKFGRLWQSISGKRS